MKRRHNSVILTMMFFGLFLGCNATSGNDDDDSSSTDTESAATSLLDIEATKSDEELLQLSEMALVDAGWDANSLTEVTLENFAEIALALDTVVVLYGEDARYEKFVDQTRQGRFEETIECDNGSVNAVGQGEGDHYVIDLSFDACEQNSWVLYGEARYAGILDLSGVNTYRVSGGLAAQKQADSSFYRLPLWTFQEILTERGSSERSYKSTLRTTQLYCETAGTNSDFLFILGVNDYQCNPL